MLFHWLTISTSLDASRALTALSTQTAHSESLFGGDTTGRQFRGRIEGDRFVIGRCIGYRNSFLPIMFGRIEPAGLGSQVRVFMRPSLFVLAFVGAAAIALVPALFVPDGSPLVAFVLVPMALITLGGFWPEALIASKLLKNTFDAR